MCVVVLNTEVALNFVQVCFFNRRELRKIDSEDVIKGIKYLNIICSWLIRLVKMLNRRIKLYDLEWRET